MPTGTAETVTIMLSLIETMGKELAQDMGDRLRKVQEKEGLIKLSWATGLWNKATWIILVRENGVSSLVFRPIKTEVFYKSQPDWHIPNSQATI